MNWQPPPNGEAYSYAYDNDADGCKASWTNTECLSAGREAVGRRRVNQTKVKTSTGIWEVVYNAENHPVSFTNSESNTVVECSYDHMGRRATKKVTENSNVTLHQRYLYRDYLQIDSQAPHRLLAPSGQTRYAVCPPDLTAVDRVAACDLKRSGEPCLWHITWDPTEETATRPLAIRKDGTWYCYGWDLTKNICEVFKSDGYIGTAYTYTPYGAAASTGTVTQPIQWSSEYADTETALTYYNYRHYNPNEGRWIRRDYIFDSSNTYAYCNNNINAIDELGLSSPSLGTTRDLNDCCYIFTIKVDAKGFSYSSGTTFLKSLYKLNYYKNESSVGHTWIRLENTITKEVIEGGHSGEDPDVREPGIGNEYFETYTGGVYALVDMNKRGDKAPYPHIPEADPQNPIRWLWHIYQDGIWAEGSGGHKKVTSECSWCISKEAYELTQNYIDEIKKDIKYYGLTGNQCTSTAAKTANKAGINVNPYVTLNIPQQISEGKNSIRLWNNPAYSIITFALPDKMQDIMKNAGNGMKKSCR